MIKLTATGVMDRSDVKIVHLARDTQTGKYYLASEFDVGGEMRKLPQPSELPSDLIEQADAVYDFAVGQSAASVAHLFQTPSE